MWPPYVEVIAAMQVLKHIIEQLGNPFESFEPSGAPFEEPLRQLTLGG